jgi:hypothetical protein
MVKILVGGVEGVVDVKQLDAVYNQILANQNVAFEIPGVPRDSDDTCRATFGIASDSAHAITTCAHAKDASLGGTYPDHALRASTRSPYAIATVTHAGYTDAASARPTNGEALNAVARHRGPIVAPASDGAAVSREVLDRQLEYCRRLNANAHLNRCKDVSSFSLGDDRLANCGSAGPYGNSPGRATAGNRLRRHRRGTQKSHRKTRNENAYRFHRISPFLVFLVLKLCPYSILRNGRKKTIKRGRVLSSDR